MLGIVVTADDHNINDYLVEHNYAVEYYGQSKTEVASKHEENYKRLVERSELVDQH